MMTLDRQTCPTAAASGRQTNEITKADLGRGPGLLAGSLPPLAVRRLWRAAFCGLTAAIISSLSLHAERLTLNFNPDWRFLKADPAGAEDARFDDQGWQPVSAPHTYNDDDTFDDWSILGHIGEQNQWAGRTWYRKHFSAPAAWKGKRVYIEFESVRQIAEVYLNGQLLGVSKTGFTPFGFELTTHLKPGESNVLAVMVDNRFMKDPIGRRAIRVPAPKDLNVSAPASTTLQTMLHEMESGMPDEIKDLPAELIPWNNPHWHPAHGGIYRNVRLHVVDPLHITLPLYSFLQTDGPYVYASDISSESARVSIEIPVQNGRAVEATVELQADVFDAEGKCVLTLKHAGGTLAPGARDSYKLSRFLAQPCLWSPDSPNLYRVVCSLRVGGETVDAATVALGIRHIRWAETGGLHVNGTHVKLHGWGQKPTDEWPGLGAAQPNWMHFHTLQLMKEAGGNFVRWGHCPGGPVSIDAADRLGIVTLQPGLDGEADTRGAAWKLRASAFRDILIYYRNHPSIFIWEGGNQKISREHVKELRAHLDRYDPHGGRAYAHRRPDEVVGEFMDVSIGTEGGNEVSRLPVVEGEYNREESPRRVWDDFSPPNFGYVEVKQNPSNSYQLNSEQFATRQVEHYMRKLSPAAHGGGANWIFSDSTSGGRVACEVARASGEVDGVRLPKEAYYVCAAIFRDDPQVHIIGHWTYPANTRKPVYVASNGEEVELFVNGRSQGRAKPADHFLFTFEDVEWAAGEIKAVAYTGGKISATQAKRTAGAPVALKLTPITGPAGLLADGSDVVLIDVEAVDAEGNRFPTYQQRVDFEIEGPGIWRGGYNSGKIDSINHPYLDLEAGVNRIAVRSTRVAGAITVRARAAGLAPGVVTVTSGVFAVENGATATMPMMPDATQYTKERIPARTPRPSAAAALAAPPAGRYITAFSYSGKSGTAHIERDAQDGRPVYVDRNFAFLSLPDELKGADWIAAAASDAGYSAVDLMEIAVRGGCTISVAYDDSLARPAWLTQQFHPTDLRLVLNQRGMRVFQRHIKRDESFTLGSNFEGSTPANMFVVLVNAAK